MRETEDQKIARLTALREVWRWIQSRLDRNPLVFKAALASALIIVLGVASTGAHEGYRVTAFAVPAAEQTSVPWDLEVAAFGFKVSQAFGVRRSTATEFAGWILEASERQNMDPRAGRPGSRLSRWRDWPSFPARE